MSRFPIKRQVEHVFSYGLYGDAEAAVGGLYAEIQIDVGLIMSEGTDDIELGYKKSDSAEVKRREKSVTRKTTQSLHVFTT